MIRRGFTLIELLLAVALLTMLATAAVSWAVSQRRSGARIEERYEQLLQALACRQALHEDLSLATTTVPRPDATGRLVVTTLRRLVDTAPGRAEVLWSFDGERQALVRISRDASGEQRRLVVGELSAARFTMDEQRGLVLDLHWHTGAPLRLAVRSGR